MNTSKPRMAIVSSHKICCPLAYYADALKEFLDPSFDVEIIDLKTSELLRQEGVQYQKLSDAYIDQLCTKLRAFDVVNIHLEMGLYGTVPELIVSRIIKLCQASGRLILTVHTIDYKAEGGHASFYRQIMQSLKKRVDSNPFHLIAHLPQEGALLKKHFEIPHVSDFPLIFLTDARRRYFEQLRNPTIWKKQFGFKENDVTIGVFGIISPHKNYLHALRTLNILPVNYKLLIIGEAHHMNIKEWQVDSSIQEMVSYLDSHAALANRVFFTGRRDDAKYYEDLVNVDFVLLPSFEVGQSGSATLCNAFELSCAIVKSNNLNSREYEKYFPSCFEVFDIGNYYETKDKILNFDRNKIANLRHRAGLFSEVQLRQMYMSIYESMKSYTPVPLSSTVTMEQSLKKKMFRSLLIKTIFHRLPLPAQLFLKKLKK